MATRHNKGKTKQENVLLPFPSIIHPWCSVETYHLSYLCPFGASVQAFSPQTHSCTQIHLNLTQQWIIKKPAAKLARHINQVQFTNLITGHENQQLWNLSGLTPALTRLKPERWKCVLQSLWKFYWSFHAVDQILCKKSEKQTKSYICAFMKTIGTITEFFMVSYEF